MVFIIRSMTTFSLLFLLASCGGGSEGSTPPPVTIPTTPPTVPTLPTPTSIIANAADHNIDELNKVAEELVSSRYTGITNDADIDVVLAQRAFLALFNDDATEAPDIGDEYFQDRIDANGNIDAVIACTRQGSVRYKGKLNPRFEGNLSLTYQNCQSANHISPITGSAAIAFVQMTDTVAEVVYYYDNLHWNLAGQQLNLTGSSTFIQTLNRATYEQSIINQQQLLFIKNNSEQVRLNATLGLVEAGGEKIELAGDLFFGDQGKISLEFDNIVNLPPQTESGRILLTGNNIASFEFISPDGLFVDDPYVLYLEDIDGDQNYDVGTYFSNLDDLLYGSAATKQIVAIADLSLPPQVSHPHISYLLKLDTTTPIEVSPGTIYDPDTPSEELEVSYRWYINGNVVIGQTTNILPAYIAVYGDDLQVSMVVSDSVNTVEGRTRAIELADAPLQFNYTNLPESVNAGDVIQFLVQFTDPDTNTSGPSGVLIAGPEGAVLGDNGMVTWTTPSDLLFPFQNYEFTFGIMDASGNINDESSAVIKVESAQSLPIARSGIEFPMLNQSMFVGDFDDDGQNEVLSTDGAKSVFLLALKNGHYRQKWLYPFKPSTKGNVVQVLSANIDNDNAQEIIIVTEKGISTINDLGSLDQLLLETSDYIIFATVQDIDNDGIPEIAYLHSFDRNGFDNNNYLSVVSVNNPTEILFSVNLADARQIEFANVDHDESFEIISNNGLVYDTSTWENQWASSTKFGKKYITTGDYNGDGVDEIVGDNDSDHIAVYSALTKSVIASVDYFDTCSLHSDDIDNDGRDEFLSGGCQWGTVNAYKLIDNNINLLWQVDSRGNTARSITSGDSDNDGAMEVHWGTNSGHIAGNLFITANVNGSDAEIKKGPRALHLDSYSAAGWGKIDTLEEKAMFFIPTTFDGYGDSRVVKMDKHGDFDVSKEISDNVNESSSAATTDYNNDGFGDIFLPSGQGYKDTVSAMQLHDDVIQWSSTTPSANSSIDHIKAYDLNGDGFDDAIYTDDLVIKAFDINNQTLIFNRNFGRMITDIVPFRLNNKPTVLVASEDKLSLLISNGSAFSDKFSLEQECHQLALMNTDNDADMELLCLQGSRQYKPQQLIVFEIGSANFVEVDRYDLNVFIKDMVVDPSKEYQQNLFVTTQVGRESYVDSTAEYTIKKMTSSGRVIWSSPNLIGEPTKQGLKARNVAEVGLELLLSTKSMMYWIH